MQNARLSGARFALVAAAVALAVPAVASAQTVFLNVAGESITNSSAQTTQRLRFDSTGGVDQMLFKGGSPAGFPAADRVRMNSTNTGSVSYTFSVTHDAATQTYTYALTDAAATGGASLVGGGNGTLTRSFAPGELSYNVLHVFMVTDSGATASFSDLAFTAGSGLSTDGALQSAASVTNASFSQWLAAPTGTNLGDFDWSMTARVTLAMNGARPSAERLKFELSSKNATFVPTPGAVATLGLAGLVALRRRR
jgi:hypothetical protein